ncbi:MAG: GMC oxidoreductase [Chitinophagales bacterium]
MEKIRDYTVIGSGFGGSVSAMRLSEKGYNVAVLEKGKRYRTEDFPKSNWNLKKYLWVPIIKFFGFQKLTFFKNVFVLSGVGVGGGSLVYANTHMVPPDAFFNNPSWGHLKDWKNTLAPFYDLAKKMLGTIPYPKFYEEDRLLKEVANDMGRGDTFAKVNVGVYYGDTKKWKDPYFKGLGPQRKGCVECAGCMVGCRYGAKNTLDKNYLYFAEKFGAEVHAETLVTKIEYKDGIYHIHTQSSTSWFGRNKKVYKSKGLIVSGGVLGTMQLLLKQKYELKTMPGISDTLGAQLRTNSESLCGVMGGDRKLNNGVAISTVFNPDNDTHVEIVKFPDHSGALSRLSTIAAGEGNPLVRTSKMIGNIIAHPMQTLRAFFTFNQPRTGIIFLVMQSLDNSMKMIWKKGLFGSGMKISNRGQGKVPAFIPQGQEVMKRYAKKVNGVPMNALTEIMFNMSTTAHILGGCPMGKSKEESVINENFEVHGYPNMHVLDGSVIQGNLGVNPSLTITALSEYAMSQIPEKPGNTQKSLDQLMQQQEQQGQQQGD